MLMRLRETGEGFSQQPTQGSALGHIRPSLDDNQQKLVRDVHERFLFHISRGHKFNQLQTQGNAKSCISSRSLENTIQDTILFATQQCHKICDHIL